MQLDGVTAKKLQNPLLKKFIKTQSKHWQLHILILLPLIYVLLFNYGPMYGIQMAFKRFRPSLGIWQSPWVGFRYFIQLFGDYHFPRLMKDTIVLSVTNLVVGFPFPILLAVGINELTRRWYRKTVQLITYAPYFISTVIVIGIVNLLLDSRLGPVSQLYQLLGGQPIDFLKNPGSFIPIYVGTDIWKNSGYTAIIYIAALSSIDPCLYEAALIDGASKLQKIWHIDIPAIIPTAVILLILSVGYLMNVSVDKALLLQNDFNIEASDILSVYIYKIGLVNSNYSMSTAVNLFNSAINICLVYLVNRLAKKVSGTGLW